MGTSHQTKMGLLRFTSKRCDRVWVPPLLREGFWRLYLLKLRWEDLLPTLNFCNPCWAWAMVNHCPLPLSLRCRRTSRVVALLESPTSNLKLCSICLIASNDSWRGSTWSACPRITQLKQPDSLSPLLQISRSARARSLSREELDRRSQSTPYRSCWFLANHTLLTVL